MFLKLFGLQRTVKIESLHKCDTHFQHFLIGLFSFHTFCAEVDPQAAAQVAETFEKDLIIGVFADMLDVFPVYFDLGRSSAALNM